MIEIVRYDHNQYEVWNEFVRNSKNGHFMFFRDYMEYHSDRFQDYSLMCYYSNKLVAVLPAHRMNDELISHNGLSFGGFVLDTSLKLKKTISIFDELRAFMKSHGFLKLVYKTIPNIYHTQPAMEDLYALYCSKASIINRVAISVINFKYMIRFEKARRSCIKKAIKSGLEVFEDYCFESFFCMLNENLHSKYSAKPVHSLYEIKYLKRKFPENIKLFSAYKGDALVAAILVFLNYKVIKIQYITSNEMGRDCGAIDFLIDYFVSKKYIDLDYLDFGSSVDSNYEYGFNESLIKQKEMFGARTIVHDTYEIII